MKSAKEILNGNQRIHWAADTWSQKSFIEESMEEYAAQFKQPEPKKECKHEWVESPAGFNKCYHCGKYND